MYCPWKRWVSRDAGRKWQEPFRGCGWGTEPDSLAHGGVLLCSWNYTDQGRILRCPGQQRSIWEATASSRRGGKGHLEEEGAISQNHPWSPHFLVCKCLCSPSHLHGVRAKGEAASGAPGPEGADNLCPQFPLNITLGRSDCIIQPVPPVERRSYCKQREGTCNVIPLNTWVTENRATWIFCCGNILTVEIDIIKRMIKEQLFTHTRSVADTVLCIGRPLRTLRGCCPPGLTSQEETDIK